MNDYNIQKESTLHLVLNVTNLSSTDGKTWTLASSPAYDVELEVEYETALALNEVDDNAATLEEWNGYEADVTLTRTLTKDMWNTIALPFSISSSDIATLKSLLSLMSGSIAFKELKSSSFADGKLTLNFGDATEIKAGHPYLVKTSLDVNFATLPATIDYAILMGYVTTNPLKGVIISKDIVPTETTAVDFIPTLGKTTIPAGEPKAVLFLASGNTLMNPESLPADMKGFRAYFQLKGEAAAASSFCLNIDGEATGIETTNFTNDTNSSTIYDLQGRKVENVARKGVYIQNGKKVIIK